MYIKNEDTIYAPATVPGTGAISVIRVSGPEALTIADKVIRCRKGRIAEAGGYTIKFGTICAADGHIIDEVLTSIFRSPHSYTGEDSVEISSHASSYIVSEIMGLLHEAGARAAEPGEFTQRAYLNGKMDLINAEAVMELIVNTQSVKKNFSIAFGTLALIFAGIYLAYPFIWLIKMLGVLIEKATAITPFFMGIVISVVMGVLLTMPTSSAAIWISIASGVSSDAMLLAGGAAVVGCSCHMIGFAVASFKENGVSGLISQGIGTSMLQIPNIMKKPIIMLPMIISSAILGPLSTCVFMLKCSHNGGGMGTSGFVGVIDLFTNTTGTLGIVGIILLMLVLPAI